MTRDDDPTTGTFLTRDPMDGVNGTPTTANPYHYADNDPMNRADPSGLRPHDCATGDSIREESAEVWPWSAQDDHNALTLAGLTESRCILGVALADDDPVASLAGDFVQRQRPPLKACGASRFQTGAASGHSQYYAESESLHDIVRGDYCDVTLEHAPVGWSFGCAVGSP